MSDKKNNLNENTRCEDMFGAANALQRNGILNGISWRTYETNPRMMGCSETPVLHIGTIFNFQIHLARKNIGRGLDNNEDYRMQLWEMTVVPQFDEQTGQFAASPQYTILIPDFAICAADLDEAKCAAVTRVMEYALREYETAKQRFETIIGIFGDLNRHLAERTAKRRANQPIETLGLTNATVNRLQALNVYVIGELVNKTSADLKNVVGIGAGTVNEIVSCLHRANLRLADKTTDSINAEDIELARKAAETAQKQKSDNTSDTPDEPDTPDAPSGDGPFEPDSASE